MGEKIFTTDELIALNETMLGRGMPVQQDGIGYNKGDFGACSTYYYGLSDAQVADLAKRLVKYCVTQLDLDKEKMKETAQHYAEIAGSRDRSDGISLDITEEGTMISFRYNEEYVEIIKQQPRRQYDGNSRNWVVPNADIFKVLTALEEAGADIKNAVRYALNHPLIVEKKEKKIDILAKIEAGFAFLKFDYNSDIVNNIKKIPKEDRKWNQQFKYWAIRESHMNELKKNLDCVANFKYM